MATQIEAELKRQAAGGGPLVDWELVADAASATGRSDPVVDYGVRNYLGERYAGGLTPVVATLTASGDTEIDPAPGPGLAIKFYWITAINDPDESSNPLIKIKAGAGGVEYYRQYALAHWEPFVLPANTALVGNLSEAGSVAVTVHRKIVSA